MSEIERLVEQIIEETARESIGDEIKSVHAISDVDHYGDDIFRVKIVFDPKTKDGLLDSRKTIKLVSRILPKFSENGVDGFPVVSYISVSDYKSYRKAHPEFA